MMERTNRKSHLQPLSPEGKASTLQNLRLDGSSPSASSSTTAQTPTSSDMDVYMQSLSIDPGRGSIGSGGTAPGQSGFATRGERPFPVRTSSATNGVIGGSARSGSAQGGGSMMQIPTRGKTGI